jgi:uncharacterized membrane protein
VSPFLSGALGAVTVLLLAGLVRRVLWRGRFGRGLRRRGIGPGTPFFLRRLYARLGTRPEQERVLSGEADALAKELGALREDSRALRAELADLLAAPAVDAAALNASLEARLARLDAVKARLAGGLARIHAALDPAQRTELAVLVRHGLRRSCGVHPRHA